MTDQEINKAVERKLGIEHHDLCHCPEHKNYCNSLLDAWELLGNEEWEIKRIRIQEPDGFFTTRYRVWSVRGGSVAMAEEITVPIAIVQMFLRF